MLSVHLKWIFNRKFHKLQFLLCKGLQVVVFSLGSVLVRGIERDLELGFLRFGFRSCNSDRTKTEPRPNSLVFWGITKIPQKKPNSSVSVWGIGSDSELGFFRFGFWSRNSDRTKTEPRPNISSILSKKFGSSYLQTLSTLHFWR